MIICDNCGESITHSGDGEITCGICGVIQQRFSQAVIEEFSSSYTQTQKIGRLKPSEPITVGTAPTLPDEEAESREFHFIVGIQLVLENLCKTLVKSFGFSNQVEVEAKNIWTRYLTFVVENDVPISNMFSDPLTRGDKYYVDSQYLKHSLQVPIDIDKFNIPRRMHKVIRDMGQTSFEYTTMLCIPRGRGQYEQNSDVGNGGNHSTNDAEPPANNDYGDISNPAKRKRPILYDYTDVKAYIENSDMPSIFTDSFETGVELPRSRRCSPTGFPIYMLEDMLAQRKIPSSPFIPNVTGYLEPSNPYRIAYMMESLYRHDFLWRLLYAYPHLEPLEGGFEVHTDKYGSIPSHDIVYAIEAHPLEWSELCTVAENLRIEHVSDLSSFRHCRVPRLRIDLINEIYVRLFDVYVKGAPKPDKGFKLISWIAPRMDLQLVCSILFLALLKCRYAIVVNDIVRWVIQGRLPLRRSASLLPDRILSAAFREGKMVPRMRSAWTQQDEMAYNLFTNTRAPHSSKHLELTTSRLLACGILGDGDEESSEKQNYNVHGLCRRIVHHLRLPSHVLPVADMIINRVITSKCPMQYDKDLYADESISVKMGHTGAIYGTCSNGFPLHVLAAASVLSACRMLWPVFHYNAPAYPRRTVPHESSGDPTTSDGFPRDNTSEKHIIKRDRFSQEIEFDPGRMSWIVRVPVRLKGDSDIATRVNDAVTSEAGFDLDTRNFLSQIASTMRDEVATDALAYSQMRCSNNAQGRYLYQSICESIQSSSSSSEGYNLPGFLEPPDETVESIGTKVYFFNARRLGYKKAGINALLWLFHHQPSVALRACSMYHIPSDIMELRRIAALDILHREPSALSKAVAWHYLDTLSLTTADHNVLLPLQNPQLYNLWFNMSGFWSGSVVNCIVFQAVDFYFAMFRKAELSLHMEEIMPRIDGTNGLDRSIAVLSECLTNDDVITELTASMPGNRQIYYTVTELFGGYPYYSGWSPEKSLEFDCYWSLVRNQRAQVLEGAKETLTTHIAEEHNTTWSHMSKSLEDALHLDTTTTTTGDEITSWPDYLDDPRDWCNSPPEIHTSQAGNRIEDAYQRVLEHMQLLFQEMGTVTVVGRHLPPNPWRDYTALRADLPVAYLVTLRCAAHFIGAPHTTVHSCVCHIENVLTQTLHS